MEIDESSIRELKGLLADPKKIVLVSHTNPDGDALGSMIAWKEVLTSMGHTVTMIVPNRFPSFLEWMEGVAEVKIFKFDKDGSAARWAQEAELIFCMDFNQIDRLEGLSETLSANTTAKKILIDHHLDPPQIYDVSFSDPHISSTSFLVYKLIVAIAGEDAITKQMAEGLYVGMMTDTGNFSFSYLTSDLYQAVGTLVDKGIDIPKIHSLVYNSFTVDRLRLLGYAINKMEVMRVAGRGVAYIALRESELRRFNFQQGDSEGFVNFPLTVRDLDMSVIFIETRHFIRISFRSRGEVNVSEFAAKYFNGGGHRNASGGKSFAPIRETVENFRKAVSDYFGEEELDQQTNPHHIQVKKVANLHKPGGGSDH